MKNITLKIPGMSCGHCVESIGNLLDGIAAVKNHQIDLDKKIAEISFDDEKISIEEIIEEIEDIGFDVEI